jgi:hypothetical protein
MKPSSGLTRSTIATLVALAVLALAGPAQGHELTPPWGYALIDDTPFNDPAGGALLPTTQVFPRGHIRDTLVDQRDVRLTVVVFTPGNASPQDSYKIEEGDFKDVPIDRRLDINPFQVSYVAYDFCRFNPSNGAVEVCEPRYRVERPAPPPPAAPPQDADGDGYPVPADCWDQNATVHPGAPEIPGNAIDDDCTGGDAPAKLAATIRNKWKARHGRVWVSSLSVVEAPEGARVEVTCKGKRCPFKRRTATVNAKGSAYLKKYFKRKLRPKLTIEVRVTYPNTIGRVGRFRIKRPDIPSMQRLCLPPGQSKARRCA